MPVYPDGVGPLKGSPDPMRGSEGHILSIETTVQQGRRRKGFPVKTEMHKCSICRFDESSEYMPCELTYWGRSCTHQPSVLHSPEKLPKLEIQKEATSQNTTATQYAELKDNIWSVNLHTHSTL